jgi:hypothetical protein
VNKPITGSDRHWRELFCSITPSANTLAELQSNLFLQWPQPISLRAWPLVWPLLMADVSLDTPPQGRLGLLSLMEPVELTMLLRCSVKRSAAQSANGILISAPSPRWLGSPVH